MRRHATAIDDPVEPVGSIMCFLVAPGHRGKGVGTALLNAACNKFRRDKLQVAEGYPTTNPIKRAWETPWAEENYKGILEHVSQSRLQDPSPSRTFRNPKKAALNLTVLRI